MEGGGGRGEDGWKGGRVEGGGSRGEDGWKGGGVEGGGSRRETVEGGGEVSEFSELSFPNYTLFPPRL